MSQASTVKNLRVHIDELSGQIETQKQALRNLEEQRSQARRQLNTLLDPMARLPLEIQSKIFQSVPYSMGYQATTYPTDVPTVFLGVCQLWHLIALSTPQLWNTIAMDFLPRRECYTELCRNWMERGRTLPLSLTLEGSHLRLADSVQDLVTDYRHQIESLTLKLTNYTHREVSLHEVLNICGPFPALRKLSIRSDRGEILDGVDELLDLLRDAPNISECTLLGLFQDEESLIDSTDISPLTLSSLENLQLGYPHGFTFLGGRSGSSAAVLPYLTLPSLKSIHLTVLDITHEALVSFFTRSSPLECLDMALPDEWPQERVIECMCAIPILTSLKLSSRRDAPEDEDCIHPFLEVLTTSNDLLPNLRKLTLEIHHSAPVDYDAYLRMLTVRRSCQTPLESFEVLVSQYGVGRLDATPNLPDAEVGEALRKLVRDGMQIHVGVSGRKNFLDL
ncbi:hypothetical protein FB45DRAFT_210037 [Roridomyces roridus]|uniref:F-box domain-containing protein n=1 Tax=Roridomyces roridus TaxID=1738132 RepID=A0AAD7FX51_9AGAR|nr:hypothetical protein FB45DRAFT_210037 [Roridomyces roridus]